MMRKVPSLTPRLKAPGAGLNREGNRLRLIISVNGERVTVATQNDLDFDSAAKLHLQIKSGRITLWPR
jgi:hypothetical protein